MRGLSVVLVLLLVGAACGPQRRSPDRGGDDRKPDAGENRPADGGEDPVDAGQPDAGEDPADAGEDPVDAGPPADGGHPTNGTPAATIATPSSFSGDVLVQTILFDSESDPVNVTFEWSSDGSNYSPATTSSSLIGLASAPSGINHSFVWRSGIDLADRSSLVKLRVRPSDEWSTGQAATTDFFTIDNERPNEAPTVDWATVPASARGDTVFAFNAYDDDADPVTATVQYRVGAGGWQTPTLVAPVTSPIAATAAGTTVSFTWRTASDIPANAPDVWLRVAVSDGRATSAYAESAAFAVNNAPFVRPPGVRIVEVNAGGSDGVDWLDLTNLGTQTVDLRGWKLGWSSDTQRTIATIPAEGTGDAYSLTPGETVTLSDATSGNAPDTIYLPSNIGWIAGKQGHAALLDPEETAVDFVRWGGSPEQAPEPLSWSEPKVAHLPAGDRSLVRRQGFDTLASTDFCVAAARKGAGQESCVTAAPVSALMRLTEISSGAGDSDTASPVAWVELVNKGGNSLHLRGWSLHSASGQSYAEYTFGDLTIPSGGRLVMRAATGTSTSTTLNVGSDKLSVSSSGAVSLVDPTGEPHDYVRWGTFADVPPPPVAWPSGTNAPGVRAGITTLSRTSESFSAVTSDSAPGKWCLTSPTRGSAATSCLPPPNVAGLRISEVIHYQNWLSLTSTELELANTGVTPINLHGFALSVGSMGGTFGDETLAPGERRHIPDCGLTSPAGCMSFGFLTFAANASAELVDWTGRSVDFVRWGTSTAAPTTGGTWNGGSVPQPAAGQSVARKSGVADSNSASDWCLQASTPGNANGPCL